MGFLDDVKEDQTLQIQVLCVAFFLIAFPSYFMLKASSTENPTGMGGVGTYTVTAEFTEIDFASGDADIQDGTPFTLALNTDSVDAAGKNIVGVRATVTYSETNEDSTGFPCAGYQTAEDTVNTRLMHDVFEQSRSAIVSGESVAIEWYDSSLLGITVENMTDSMIELLLSGMGIGDGEHSLNIGVIANSGSGNPGCGAGNDPGESVSWMIELISLDYTITLVE